MDDGDRVIFWARLDADERYKMFRVDPDGGGEAEVEGSEIPRAGDDGFAEIGPSAASPDGELIAFAADQTASGLYDVWVLPAAGGDALRVTSGVTLAGTNPSFVRPLWWSPGGTRIAFVADYALASKDEPYVVAADGGGQMRLAVIAGDGAQDADQLAWAADGSALVMVADHRVDEQREVFALDPDQEDQEPALVFAAAGGGDADGVLGSR
jgi:hypothetical protein